MYKRTFKIVILFLSLVAFSYAGIDTTIGISIDLTADGINDSLFCHLTGVSWKKPLKVTYKILSKNKLIFSETYDDKIFDEDFNNRNNLDWCDKEYLICKKKWYFEIMWKKIIKTVKLKDKRRDWLFDTTSNTSIPRLVEKLFIDSLGYSKDKAVVEAKKLTTNLKKRNFSCLVLPIHPIYPSFPSLYEPHSKKLIILYGY